MFGKHFTVVGCNTYIVTATPPNFDSIILRAAHEEFKAMGAVVLRSFVCDPIKINVAVRGRLHRVLIILNMLKYRLSKRNVIYINHFALIGVADYIALRHKQATAAESNNPVLDLHAEFDL